MKKTICIYLFLCFHLLSQAQLLGSIKLPEEFIRPTSKADSTILVHSILKSGVFVIAQQYQVSDRNNGEVFGLNGKQEFGTSYSLGVKVKGGFMLTDLAVRPWIYDENYAKFQERYAPLPYRTYYWEVSDTLAHNTLASDLRVVSSDSLLYEYTSDVFHQEGFQLDRHKGEEMGWLIWIVASKNADLTKPSQVDFLVTQQKIALTSDSIPAQIPTPKTDKIILGGMFLQTVHQSLGVLEFHLASVMARQNQKWFVCPTMQGDGTNDGRNVRSSNPDTLTLTPVEASQEKEKGKSKEKDRDKDKKKKK